jgi:ABC-type multidrug transport system fused ATPase/permease subunit
VTGDPPGRRDRTIPRLAAMLWPERGRLAVMAVFCLLSVSASVAGPALLGEAANIVFSGVVSKLAPAAASREQAIAALRAHGQGQLADIYAAMNIAPHAGIAVARLGTVLGLAAGAYGLSLALSYAQAYVLAGASERTVYRLRERIEDKLARLPLSFFDRQPHGDVISRVVNDVDNIASNLEEVLGQLPAMLFTTLGVIGIMFWFSPLLATFSLAAIPVILAAGGLIASRSKSRFEAQWKHTGNLTALAEENFTGLALVQAFGRQEQAEEDFRQENQRLTRASFGAQFLSGGILPLTVFVGNLNYVGIAAIGGYWVATGAISFGTVQAFIQYSGQLTGRATQFASQLNQVQSGLASAKRVFEFLDTPEEVPLPGLTRAAVSPNGRASLNGSARANGSANARAGESAARAVRFQDVCFRYDPDTPLIEDFTLEAAPGQTVAIVGPTGAGKTTVVNLLVRFYEIDSGRILLDGVDYRDLSRDEVRRCFGMVLQDTWLFGGTVRDNIAYGRHDASDGEIEAAARAAHAHDFIATLPCGYTTVLDDDASVLSVGQKQLLAIARAFLTDPAILILDEATSSVDTRTEALIQSGMARLRAGRTSFVIAHRLSTVRDADAIVVMAGGRVVEQGTHDDLIGRRGAYYDLYSSQFAKTEN